MNLKVPDTFSFLEDLLAFEDVLDVAVAIRCPEFRPRREAAGDNYRTRVVLDVLLDIDLKIADRFLQVLQ